MGMEDLAAAAMATVMPEIAEQMEQAISDDTWRAIEAGDLGLGFDVLLRAGVVEVTCTLRHGIAFGNDLVFKVSRTVVPPAVV